MRWRGALRPTLWRLHLHSQFVFELVRLRVHLHLHSQFPCHPKPSLIKPPFPIFRFCFLVLIVRMFRTFLFYFGCIFAALPVFCSMPHVPHFPFLFRLHFCCVSSILQHAQVWSACSAYSMHWMVSELEMQSSHPQERPLRINKTCGKSRCLQRTADFP